MNHCQYQGCNKGIKVRTEDQLEEMGNTFKEVMVDKLGDLLGMDKYEKVAEICKETATMYCVVHAIRIMDEKVKALEANERWMSRALEEANNNGDEESEEEESEEDTDRIELEAELEAAGFDIARVRYVYWGVDACPETDNLSEL